MKIIGQINNYFKQCFENADMFKNAQKTSDINSYIADIVNQKLPHLLSAYVKDNNYLTVGSVGKGLATKTPWVAILDSSITRSTREGVYIVFLFSSDYKQVYITLNQGTTVPGQFGPRLGKKEVSNNSQRIRNLLKINNKILNVDGNAGISDEKYRLGAIYYTLWDVNDDDKGKEVLDLYIYVYSRYKQLTGVIKSSCKQIVNFKEANLKKEII